MLKFSKLSARRWTHIIIHHSFSPDSGLHSWDDISNYHVRVKGWAAVGYHFGLEWNGNKYIYCIGRGLDCVGAHTQGMNEQGIGICVVGDYDHAPPLDCQMWMLAELCKDLMRDFGIPIENIKRHSDYADKSCPGTQFDMNVLYDKIRTNGYVDCYSEALTAELEDRLGVKGG